MVEARPSQAIVCINSSIYMCSYKEKIVSSILMDLVYCICSFADGQLKKMELVKNWMGMEPWS